MTVPDTDLAAFDCTIDTVLANLTPFYTAAAKGDLKLIERTVVALVKDHRPDTPAEVDLAARMLGYTATAADDLRRGMQPGLSDSKILRYRANALACERAAEACRKKLARMQELRYAQARRAAARSTQPPQSQAVPPEPDPAAVSRPVTSSPAARAAANPAIDAEFPLPTPADPDAKAISHAQPHAGRAVEPSASSHTPSMPSSGAAWPTASIRSAPLASVGSQGTDTPVVPPAPDAETILAQPDDCAIPDRQRGADALAVSTAARPATDIIQGASSSHGASSPQNPPSPSRRAELGQPGPAQAQPDQADMADGRSGRTATHPSRTPPSWPNAPAPHTASAGWAGSAAPRHQPAHVQTQSTPLLPQSIPAKAIATTSEAQPRPVPQHDAPTQSPATPSLFDSDDARLQAYLRAVLQHPPASAASRRRA